MTTAERSAGRAYAAILNSTAVIGGSTAATVAFGIVRAKVMALLLGPAGVGLFGIYGSITDVTQSLAGMGIQSSGVRQIAEAVGSGDAVRIGRTVAVLKRVTIGLGGVGALALLVLAPRVSAWTFGGPEHTASVALLSLSVLLREVAAGQSALIQGLRRISDLARINVLSALTGTAVTIPLVYILGPAGVAPSLVAVAGAMLLASSWYSRKARFEHTRISIPDIAREASALLKLGSAFMVAAFLTMGSGYAIRTMVLRGLGYGAAGQYQAAWLLGGIYVTFILQAMGADFYPRLTALVHDAGACNRTVNEQTHVSLLLAGPGVIATLTLAPVVVLLFYSSQFHPAVTILRWFCLGMTLRVISWPMGYIIIAKGAQRIMIGTEVAAAVVHVGLAWILLRSVGLVGAGMAFAGLYVWHSVLVYVIVRRMTGFTWSPQNTKLARTFLPLCVLVFSSFYLLPMPAAVAFGAICSVATAAYSVRTLLQILPPESTPRVVRAWLPRLGFSAPAAP